MSIASVLNQTIDQATHYLMCRHCIGRSCREYEMMIRTTILQTTDGRQLHMYLTRESVMPINIGEKVKLGGMEYTVMDVVHEPEQNTRRIILF